MSTTHLIQFFFHGASVGAAPVVVEQPAGGTSRKRNLKDKRKKPTVIRWSDFANQEERAKALAVALAEASVPIAAAPEDFDEIADEDEALIHALLLSRIIH